MIGLGRSASNNLPPQLTTFIGREREITEVKRLLRSARLLTLTGSGGCGKTRLALQVAGDLIKDFSDGVWLVDLASLSNPAFVAQAIGTILGIPEQPGRELEDTLADSLRPRRLLLLLDNCEHVLASCTPLAEALLRECPGLRILTTSREPLGAAGEIRWTVPPLSLPDLRHLPAREGLVKYEAIRLFLERGVAAHSTFAMTSTNARAVAQVCWQLDGIPLAIELVAPWVRVLTAEQIIARLSDRFQFLMSGNRTTLPRHLTLKTAINWSYDLLSVKERALLCRLSTFAGGWTLEAAEAICWGNRTEPSEVLDLLTRLVDKSLVAADMRNGEARYRLLETVRQYGRDRLLDSGEDVDALRRRHRDWYLDLAQHARARFHTTEQEAWVKRLRAEHDNFRVALEWSIGAGDAEPGIQLAATLAWFWYVDGHWSEGRKWLERALQMDGDVRSATRVWALMGASYLVRSQGDYERARVFAENGLTIARETNNSSDIAVFLLNLGILALQHEGDPGRGRALLEESVALARECDGKDTVAWALAQLGHIARDSTDYERAKTLYAESLASAREYGERYIIAYALRNEGVLALHKCDYAGAATLLTESLDLCRTRGPNWVTQECLVGMAEIACAERRYKKAARLFGAGDALREVLGARRLPSSNVRYEECVASTRAALGNIPFVAIWTEGRAMTLEQIIDYALMATEPPRPVPKEPAKSATGKRAGLLAPREREVALLIAEGKTNREIAASLSITENTAETHVQHILNKLGVNSRAQIAAWAVSHGLRPPSSPSVSPSDN
jgi:non-specific serine/threonine protein kinase